MIRAKLVAILTAILAVFGVNLPTRPVLTYGAGYYTNLCGSGSAANVHRCSGDCDPARGECKSESFFVAKWVCDGKSTQCGENESWANSQSLDGTACGKTVSLNVFDKNCRVGGWTCDESNLKDYMVWYSGDCTEGEVKAVITTPTLVPSVRPTVTAIPSPTLSPAIVPTSTTRPIASPSATLAPVAAKTPKTGGEEWLIIEAVGVVILGLWFQKLARRVWK